jgi:integrase
MIQLQRLTGARPGEVCSMRACDIDMSGKVWLYRPAQHKTRHRGKERVIALGPQAQEIIRPFLQLDTQAYLFSPRRALEEKRLAARAARKTKVQPSQQNRRKRKPKVQPGDRYTTPAYCYAIHRACQRANRKMLEAGPCRPEDLIPHWHPHQIRHTHATEVRRHFGLEAAQVALGHATASVTQLYAERDLSLAVKVASAIG